MSNKKITVSDAVLIDKLNKNIKEYNNNNNNNDNIDDDYYNFIRELLSGPKKSNIEPTESFNEKGYADADLNMNYNTLIFKDPSFNKTSLNNEENKTLNCNKNKTNIKCMSDTPLTKEETFMDEKYEMVNHPKHYNTYDVETIEMIARIWGPEIAALWCEITAFKYRMRMGTKPGNTIERDLKKESWYLSKAKEFKREKKY